MKIIAVLPVKNEEWILPTFLTSMKKIADEIIVLDDNSTDTTQKILEEHNVTIIGSDGALKVNMSAKRNLLLAEGRKRGGTHFIWLDADESFDHNFLTHGRKQIEELTPGQKLALPWITLWKTIDEERVDGVWKTNFKDVIVCDKPEYTFEDRDLSEGRTQGPHDHVIQIPREVGVILHFQFLNFDDAQAKQAWYRCVELLQSRRSARRINNMYSITLDNKEVKTEKTPKEWFSDIHIPQEKTNKRAWYIKEIIRMFKEKGVLFFEGLDIWHIQELREEFLNTYARNPIPRKYPSWLIALNTIKNKLKK